MAAHLTKRPRIRIVKTELACCQCVCLEGTMPEEEGQSLNDHDEEIVFTSGRSFVGGAGSANNVAGERRREESSVRITVRICAC